MLIRLVISAVVVVVCRGLNVVPVQKTAIRPAAAPAAPHVDAIKSGIFALSLCLLHAASPGVCGVALAIDAGSYADLYGSSASKSKEGFSFNLPPKEPAKKRQEAPPSLPDLPKIDVPDMPSFDVPKFDVPKFDAPKFDAPKFDAPKFDAPKFEAPKFDAPKFDAPKFEAPKFEAPKFDAPKFEAPKFEAPSVPKFDTPKFEAPSISMPPVSFPAVGGSSKPEPTPLEESDKEAIDDKARATRRDFLEADNSAKEVEKQGRKLRDIANQKKKVAKEAKDAACEYRPGGKLFCFRGLNSGF